MLLFLFLAVYMVLADLCTVNAMKKGFPQWFVRHRRAILTIYWTVHLAILILFIVSLPYTASRPLRAFGFMFFLTVYFCKLFLILAQLFDGIQRLLFRPNARGGQTIPVSTEPKPVPGPATSTRSQFITRTGFALASLPFLALNAGMISGVYDYRVRRVRLSLLNLPAAFEGMQIAQISDIHSGSFYNKQAVNRGIDLLMSLKADVVFFTGDLVNDRATEMTNYQDVFSRVKAPLGVFSILGNHDYGDYAAWPTAAAKRKNLDDLKKVHGLMGYQLLCNEHRKIRIGSDEIAILGVENWGSLSRFPKYGRVEDALNGATDSPVKLLLSHDPTHWRAKILPNFKEIDATFSGHTHGMQMGIRTPHFQWSPVQYVYKEWAGLYKEGTQSLYVNVGYGFLGYPGRIGIYPEITLFTLTKQA